VDGPVSDDTLWKTLLTRDLDEVRSLTDDLFGFPTQWRPGGRSDEFSFRVGGVKLGPLTVGDGMCGVDLGVRVENLESSYALVIPSKIVGVQQQGPIVAATPSNAVLLRPCGGYELTWPRETSVLSVTVDRAVLENEVGSSSALRAGHPGIDLTTPLARGWLSLVRVLLREVDDPHSRVRQPDMARRWSQLVVNGLAILLDEPHQEERVRRTRLLRPRPVKHALDVMHANPAHPFTLAELARAAGVGPRTLQHAFHRYVGMSPLSYLRDLRLSQAHDDLGQADPRETSVGEIAYRCGFTHLGRFAGVYRTRYGVSPSQTLHGRRLQ
jgi:AraC-like DNA-binding protein